MRSKVQEQIDRARQLYEWGDYTKTDYQTRRDELARQFDALGSVKTNESSLERLAGFLNDVPSAWEQASEEQRNRLGRALFDQLWIMDDVVVAAKPREELEGFFQLNYEESSGQAMIEGPTLTSYPSSGRRHLKCCGNRSRTRWLPSRGLAERSPIQPTS